MRSKKIKAAARAAQEFMNAVEDYNKRKEDDEYFARFCEICGFKETAAVRRASMDLTRTLAKMRKP